MTHPGHMNREQRRWLRSLLIEFLAASVFVAAAFATGYDWLMIPALLCGPSFAGVITIVYLALSSDTNGVRTALIEKPARRPLLTYLRLRPHDDAPPVLVPRETS